MDVFLTPLFGHWLPRRCNDLVTGRGAFSHDFNEKRLNAGLEELLLTLSR